MAVILVTGGAGYVGSHACKALAKAGHEPVVFDNLSTGWREAVQFGPLVEGDLSDRGAIAGAIAQHRPSAILHFAALSEVGHSAREPGRYWANNVTGSLNLVTEALAGGIDKLVFSSTCAVYGALQGEAFTEDHPRAPINVYGQTKLAVEHMLEGFEAAHGLRTMIFRYFNAAGADATAQIGEDHRPESHLIPLVLDAADGKRPEITVFGSDYPTPDGTCIRDYIHVTDLADAHVRGLEWLLDGGAPLRLNLGSRSGHSVQAVIDMAARVTGREIPVAQGARREGDPPRLVSGSDLAEQRLGWVPRHSALETMIGDAWRWHLTGKYPGRC